MCPFGDLTEVFGTADGLDSDGDVVRIGAAADDRRQQHPLRQLEAGDGVVGEIRLATAEPLRVGESGDRDRQQRRGEPARRRRFAVADAAAPG